MAPDDQERTLLEQLQASVDRPGLAKTPVLAEVIRLYPDGVFVREEKNQPDTHWIYRQRNSQATSAVAYTLVELVELYNRLGDYLEERT